MISSTPLEMAAGPVLSVRLPSILRRSLISCSRAWVLLALLSTEAGAGPSSIQNGSLSLYLETRSNTTRIRMQKKTNTKGVQKAGTLLRRLANIEPSVPAALNTKS